MAQTYIINEKSKISKKDDHSCFQSIIPLEFEENYEFYDDFNFLDI